MSMVENNSDIYRVLDLTLNIAEQLLSSGLGAQDVAEQASIVLDNYGLVGAEVDITFTSISISYQAGSYIAPQTRMRVVRWRSQDYSRMGKIEQLISDITQNSIGVKTANRKLGEIITCDHPYKRRFAIVSWGVLGGAVGLGLGGDVVTCISAFFAALGIYFINRQLHKWHIEPFFQQAICSLLVTLLAAGLVKLDLASNPAILIAAGIITILAGSPLVGALQDALTGYFVTAAARLVEVFIITAGIVVGVGLGLNVAGYFGVEINAYIRSFALTELPITLLSAAFSTLAFTYASYLPKRGLLLAAGAGSIAAGSVFFLRSLGIEAEIASGVAACCVGWFAYVVRIEKIPQLAIASAGIIPLLPGLTIYRGLYALYTTPSIEGISTLISASVIALSLGAGILLGRKAAQFSQYLQFLVSSKT